MRILAISSLLIIGLSGLDAQLAFAQGVKPEDTSQSLEAATCLQMARQAEQRGDLNQASSSYTSTLSYCSHAYLLRDLPRVVLLGEPLSSVGRRAILVQLKIIKGLTTQGHGAYKNETGTYTHHRSTYLQNKNVQLDSRALTMENAYQGLHKMYSEMIFIEPNSPTWPYLLGVMDASIANYYEGYPHLLKCLKTTGGPQSVRVKAKALADHILPGYNMQKKQVEEDWAQYQQYRASGQEWRDIARASFNTERERVHKERGW
jgi:hypothetical protein